MIAIYARQSLDKQDSISIETQIETCRYEAHGGEIAVYQDKGFSGKNMNRPDFERLLDDIKNGQIESVIVYKLDRISRSVLDFSKLMELFGEHHVEFVSCSEKFDTSNAMGRAMLNIAIVFAQLERETIQARVTDAYYSRSHKGFYMGGRLPMGFKLEKTIMDGIHTSKYVPDPVEMNVVQMIFESYAKPGASLGGILRELVEMGYARTRAGAPWQTGRISEILRNPVYVKADLDIYNFFMAEGTKIINPPEDFIGMNGCFLYTGIDGDGKKKQYDLRNRELVIAPHEGVIDSDIWLTCRRKLMKNRQCATTRGGRRSWLTGKIKCAKCGYAYQVTISSSGRRRYFQCTGARMSIKCKGAGHTIYADELEDYIYSRMKEEMKNLEYLSDEKENQKSSNCSKYELRLTELDQEADALMDRLAAANDTLFDYINKRIETIEQEKRDIRRKINEETSKNKATELNRITDFIEKWSELDIHDKQSVVDVLIARIEIGEGTLEIFWNI